MLLFLKKEKTTAIFIIALLVASVTIMSMPTKAQDLTQEGGTHGIVGGVGTTSSNIYGYPHLGPLPSGVTPFTTIYTLAYMSITPNPIGIGQQVLVNVWVSPGMPNWVYMQGLKVTIQAPDGTTQVIGPFNSYLGDATAWFQYKVDQVGTWRFKFESAGTYMPPGQYVPNPGTFPQQNPNITLGASIYFPDCSTDWQNVTVQQDMVASWPSVPLPTDYWTRPISIENREWYSIAGNYPWTGAYFYPNGRVLYSSNYK